MQANMEQISKSSQFPVLSSQTRSPYRRDAVCRVFGDGASPVSTGGSMSPAGRPSLRKLGLDTIPPMRLDS